MLYVKRRLQKKNKLMLFLIFFRGIDNCTMRKEREGKKTYDSFDIRDGIHAVWLTSDSPLNKTEKRKQINHY